MFYPTTDLPIKASLLVTNRCTNHCKHCYTSARDIRFKELTTEQWKAVMDELEEGGVFELYIGGGELFIRKDTLELLDYASKIKRFIVTISTNGILVRQNIVDKLDDRIQIQVSVDGSEKSHNLIRGPNTYKKTMKNLGLLIGAEKNVSVGTVVNKVNLPDIESVYNTLYHLGVKTWHMMRVQPAGRALTYWDELYINNQEWVDTIRLLKRLDRRNGYPKLYIDNTFEVMGAKGVRPEDFSFYLPPEAGIEITILPNGDVIPTDLVFGRKDYVIGNVLERKAGDIWRDAKIRDRFMEVTSRVNGTCNDCDIFNLCRGGSRIVAETLTHDLYAPDPYCPHDPPNYVKYD